jgi:hypothetical protein
MNRRRAWIAVLLAASVAPLATAQTAAPTTAPTTQRKATRETTPPDFVRVTAARYSAFCQPVDEAWVKQGLSQAKAESLPSTRPADILNRIQTYRDAITQGLANDLDVDAAKVTAMLDEQLIPTLKKLDTLQPPVVFMVATEAKIKAMLTGTWSHPQISYNRLMDKLKWDERIQLRLDEPMDEALLQATFDAVDPPEKRIKKLREAAEKFEADVAVATSVRARKLVHECLARFAEQEVFQPLNLRDDQVWLQLGVVNYLAGKYSPMMTGTDPRQAMADLLFERPDAPVKSDEMDLLALEKLSNITPQYQYFYVEAARRKSTQAVMALVDQGKAEAIRKALVAVKKDPPKDGIELVSRVAAATGVELSKQLRTVKVQ